MPGPRDDPLEEPALSGVRGLVSGPDTAPYALPGDQEPPRKPRSHRASQEPTTGPIHRIPFPPAGRHQENDLDPKRWPWLILVLACTVLAGAGGGVWGRASAFDAMRAEAATAEVFTPEPVPVPTQTVTKTPKPKAGPTVTRTAKASPRPTVTVTAAAASPGPTIYRAATPRPRPTVTRTREIPVCYQAEQDERMEEIPCP
jgi:hypothetical protein